MVARKAQPSLFDQDPRLSDHRERREHGGTLRRGMRKLRRPLDPRKPLHLTLRSERARGGWSMLRPAHAGRIKYMIYLRAEMYGVKVLKYANSGNHLHILLKTRTSIGFKRFLRTITGLIARLITGAAKGRPRGKFWDELAYTRVVNWGRDLFHTHFYVVMNEMEASGIWSRHWRGSPNKTGLSQPSTRHRGS